MFHFLKTVLQAAERKFTKEHPAVKPSHKGRLHRHLGVPEGEKIPEEKLRKAAHSSNPEIKKEAGYAITMSHWHKHPGAHTHAAEGVKTPIEKHWSSHPGAGTNPVGPHGTKQNWDD